MGIYNKNEGLDGCKHERMNGVHLAPRCAMWPPSLEAQSLPHFCLERPATPGQVSRTEGGESGPRLGLLLSPPSQAPPPAGPRLSRKLTLRPVCWARALAMELKLVLEPKSPCRNTRAGRVASPSRSL